MIVLDSSALLAVLLDERGAENVVATFADAVISAAMLAEVLGKLEQKGFASEDEYRRIVAFGIGILPLDVTQARIAAKIALAPRELDLSLGDRLCIALAIQRNSTLLTSDRGMLQFEAGIPIRSFR